MKTKLIASGRFPDSEEAFRRFIHLQPDDIAQAVIYVLGTGPNVQVSHRYHTFLLITIKYFLDNILGSRYSGALCWRFILNSKKKNLLE